MRSILAFIIILIFIGIGGIPSRVYKSYAEEENFIYNDHGKRDPLWPLVSSSGSTLTYDTDFLITELNLEGIMVAAAGGRNLAIINGRVLSENESVGQFIIKSISSDTVILQKDTETFELKLKKEESE